MQKPFAKISAYEPCGCAKCERHWSTCPTIHERHIATYDCAPHPDDDYRGYVRPHPKHLAWVREQHPTAELVYLD